MQYGSQSSTHSYKKKNCAKLMKHGTARKIRNHVPGVLFAKGSDHSDQ